MQMLYLCNNKIGVTEAKMLAEGIRFMKTPLQKFGIGENPGIRLEGLSSIVTALSQQPDFERRFNIVEVPSNDLRDEGAKLIINFIYTAKSLLFLNLCGNKIGDLRGRDIANALLKGHSLQQLHLCDNNLGNEAAKAIANVLQKSKCITHLMLKNNHITDVGCKSIAEALPRNCTLCELGLGGNRITDVGAAAIKVSLEHVNYALEILDLDGSSGESNAQKSTLTALCENNRSINKFFRKLKSNVKNIQVSYLPPALETIAKKPGLLFDILKAKPDWYVRGASFMYI